MTEPRKPFKVWVNWGERPQDQDDNPKCYSFATFPELEAFKLGVNEMDGWCGVEMHHSEKEARDSLEEHREDD